MIVMMFRFFLSCVILSFLFVLVVEGKALRSYQQRVPLKKSGMYLVEKFLKRVEKKEKSDIFSAIQIDFSLEKIKWDMPKSWQKKSSNGIQFALFSTPKTGLDVSLVGFPGEVGGLKANVLRWLRQMNLSQMPDDQKIEKYLADLNFTLTKTRLPFLLIDLRAFSKKKDNAIVVGVFRFSDDTLFVKIAGSSDKIALDYKNFKNFLLSFRSE